MIPTNDVELDNIEIQEQPTFTYALNTGRIRGTTNGIEAIKQAVYLILNTERYKYLAYSWNYGVEIQDLIGKDKTFVIPELKRFVIEALAQDDRITGVDSFKFTSSGQEIKAEFTVHTTVGDIETEVVI